MARANSKKPGGTKDDSATVATRVAELIRNDIIHGELPGGERLNEVALAEHYGVSRIPLREALRIVEGEGLVEIHPFTGAFVSEVSTDDVVDLFEIHETLEAMALRLAFYKLTTEDLHIAEALARRIEREPDPHRWGELVGEFYTVLYGGIERRHLLDMLRRMTTNQRRYLYLYFGALRARQPDLPRPKDFVAVLRKRNLEAALEFQQRWRKAQRAFFIEHMCSEEAAPPSPARRQRKPRKGARPQS